MDTATWPLPPILHNIGVQMWPQNPSQHSDPGSYSPLHGVRIREENNLLVSLLCSKALLWQTQRREKKQFVQDHTQDLGQTRPPVYPQSHFTFHHQGGDITDMKHYKNTEKFQKFTMTMKSPLIHPMKHARKSLSPFQGDDMSLLRSEKAVCQSWVKGRGGEWYLTTQEFLNRFSNKTNHWLFISKDQGEVTLTLTSHLCCFPSTTARGLVQVHLWTELKV